MSLGLLTAAMPEARDFVESLLPYMNLGDTFGNWEFNHYPFSFLFV